MLLSALPRAAPACQKNGRRGHRRTRACPRERGRSGTRLRCCRFAWQSAARWRESPGLWPG
eukprot:1835634-Lingulodinium_polyedra.AAC.1